VSTINVYKSASGNNYETVEARENMSIREALPELDFDRAIIAVNGFLADEGYELQDNDICTIRLFPKGSPGSSPLEIVLGIMTLGVYTAVDAIYSSVTGHTLLQDIIMSFMGDGSKTNSPESLQNIPQLKGAKNQSNKDKPIPLVLGKHLYTPMYIGSPYTEIGGADGADQYYTALYLLGWGKLKVSDIRLGPVSGLSRNVENKLDGDLVYNDELGFGDPGFAKSDPLLELRHTGEVGLYPQKVVEERLGIELLNVVDKDNPSNNSKLEPTRFSAKNPQMVQVEITFNNGLVSYNSEGKKQDASVSVRVEWRNDHTDDNGWKEFGRFGTDIGGQSPTEYNSLTHVTTIKRQKPKQMRFVAVRGFSFAEVEAATDRTIELRITRESPKDINDNRTADDVYLSAIRTWCFDNDTEVQTSGTYAGQKLPQAPMVEKYRDQTARLGFRIKATDIMQGTIDSLNCMVESYARTWNGSKWSDDEQPSSNPASVALKILQSPALGKNAYTGDAEEMLDLDSFGEFYQWCKEKKFACNGVLTNEKRVDELLNAVLSTGRGMRILNESRYAVLIDKPRENPVTILNSQNVLEAANQKNFDDLPDGFSIKFVNESDGYQETEVYVMADGSARPKPTSRIESIEMPFITDHEQIVKNGWYMLACRRLRPEVWHRKLSIDGYLVGIGSLVEVQDDTIVVGLGEGAVITGLKRENGHITEIQTDGVFDVVDVSNKLYGIKIMQFNGVNNGRVRTIQVPVPKPGAYSDFTVSIPLDSEPPLPSVGDIVAFGIYEKITTQAICFGKKPNGDGTFDVTLIPYQEGIYTADEAREIPPYNANITTPQRPDPIPYVPPYIEGINDRISDVESRTVDVNNNLYQLMLSVQSRILNCDNRGNVLEGYLPFTSQATLYHGANAVAVQSDIEHYPGTGGNLFDPMLGGFTPVDSDRVLFSLIDAPSGVSVDASGLVTVGRNAALGEQNYIIVQAEYSGQVYRTRLYVQRGIYTPRYLGACYTRTTTQTVLVKVGNETISIIARQGDWVSYLGETVSGTLWEKGVVMRYTGTQWEKVPIKADGNFESNPYVAALMDLTEGAPQETFMSILVRDLIAKTAMIERIFTYKMRVQQKIENDGSIHEGAIFGGGYNEHGNPTDGPGFYLGTDGIFKAVKAILKSINITGDSTFNEECNFFGNINAGPLIVSNISFTEPTFKYNAGTTADTIVDAMMSLFGIDSTTLLSYERREIVGSYGNQNISAIRFSSNFNAITPNSTRYIVDIAIGNSYTEIARTVKVSGGYNRNTTAQVLSFKYKTEIITNKILMLENLPTIPQQKGVVWVDGNGFLKLST
jgi:hypothetical protein